MAAKELAARMLARLIRGFTFWQAVVIVLPTVVVSLTVHHVTAAAGVALPVAVPVSAVMVVGCFVGMAALVARYTRTHSHS